MLNNFIKKNNRTNSQKYKQEGYKKFSDNCSHRRKSSYPVEIGENINKVKALNCNSEQQIDIYDTTQEIINFVKTQLESIDSNTMLDNFVKILKSFQEDIAKIFENPNLNDIQAIFENYLDLLLNYFIRWLQHTDMLKNSINENLSERLTNFTQTIKSELDNIQTKIQILSINKTQQTHNGSHSLYCIDEEFVTLINSLSQAIKGFMKNTKSCLKELTGLTFSSENNFMLSKGTLSDIMKNILVIEGIKNSQSQINIPLETKLLREKINSVMQQIDELYSFKLRTSTNIKNIDEHCVKFYDEAKLIFRGLKNLHNNDRLNDIQKVDTENNKNLDSNGSMKNPKNFDANNYYSSDNKNNLKYNKPNEYFKSRRKVDSVSPNRKNIASASPNNKKLATSKGYNLNTNGSFINPELDYPVTYTQNYIKNSRNSLKYKKQLSYNKSGNNILNKSTDNFYKRPKLTGGTNTNINTSTNISNTNTNLNSTFFNTSVNINQLVNNEERLTLFTNLEELKTRNQELLVEIAKLHELYVATYNENIHLRQENEMLKENINKQEDNKHEVQISQQLSYSAHYGSNNLLNNIKSKSLGKILSSKQTNQNHSSVQNTDNEKNNLIYLENLSNLSNMVIQFINHLTSLQEAISIKANNVKEMKIEFEIKKKDLIQYANKIKLNNVVKITQQREKDKVETNTKEDIKMKTENNSSIANEILKEDIFPLVNKLKAELNEEKLRNNEVIMNLKELVNSKNEELNRLNDNLISVKNQEDSNKRLLKEISILKAANETLILENKKFQEEKEETRKNLKDYHQTIGDMKQVAEHELLKAQLQINDLISSVNSFKEELELKNRLLDNYSNNSENLENTIKNNNKLLTEELTKKNEKILEIKENKKILNDVIFKQNEKINEINEKNKSLSIEIQKITEVMNTNKTLSSEIERKNKKITDFHDKFKILSDEINKKNESISLINEKIKSLKEENNQKNLLIEEINIKNKILTEENTNKNLKFYESSQKNNTLDNEIELKNSQISLLNDKLHSINEELTKWTSKISYLKNKIDTLTTEVDNKNINIISLTEKCNEYKQIIEENNNILLQKDSKIEDKRIYIAKLEDEINKTKNKNNILENENKSLNEEMRENMNILLDKPKFEENENSNLKLMAKNSSSSSNKLMLEIENLKNKVDNYEQNIIPEINEKSTKDLEKSKEKLQQIIIEKEEALMKFSNIMKGKEEEFLSKIKSLTESLMSKENQLTEIHAKFLGDLFLKEEENKAIENDYKNKIQLMNQDAYNKEKEFKNIISKYNTLSISKNPVKNTELEELKYNDAEKISSKINSDYNILRNEFTGLSNLLKTLYEEISENFNKLNINSKENKRTINNQEKRKRNNDEAFVFNDDFEINDENIDDYDVSFDIISKPQNNDKIVTDIINMFNIIIMKSVELEKKENFDKKEIENQNIILMNKKIDNYMEVNKKLKLLFDDCTQVIYEAIRTADPNILEKINLNEASEFNSKNPNQSNTSSFNSEQSEEDFTKKAIEIFKNYNTKITSENIRLKKDLEQSENNERRLKIIADQYKSAVELARSRGDILNTDKKTPKNEYFLNTDINSSFVFTKENAYNLAIDDLVEINAFHNNSCDSNNSFKEAKFNNIKNESNIQNAYINKIEDSSGKIDQSQEKEIRDLIAIQDDLVKKLAYKDEEISNYRTTIDKFIRISNGNISGNKTIPLEKYEILLEHYNEQLEKLNELETKYRLIKKDYEIIKSSMEITKDNESNDSIIKIIKNPINIEENDYTGKPNKISNENKKGPKNAYSNNLNNTVATLKKRTSLNYLSMLNNSGIYDSVDKTQNSGRSKKTENNFTQDAVNQAIKKFEEHEQLLVEQLSAIKEELKETRQQRDNFKKKFEESITLQDGKKNEILNLLRQAIEKLVLEITINTKIKEILTVILRVLDYNDEQINNVLNNKDKKKNLFKFFK